MKFVYFVMLLSVFARPLLFAQEVQVPVSDEQHLMSITPKLRDELQLFPEIKGFQEAKLFQLADSSFALEIFYEEQGHTVKKRVMMTPSDVQALRTRIHEKHAPTISGLPLDQSGRPLFLNTMIGLSVGYYGWSAPSLFQNVDPQAGVALYLLTAGGIILYSHSATRDMEVSKESALGFQYGAFRGIVHGCALYSIITGESSHWFIPVSSTISAVEGGVIMSSVSANHTPLGTINTVCVYSDFGMAIGVGTAYLLREGDALDLNQKDLRLLGSCVLAGSGAGYFMGRMLTGTTSYSGGDADILQSAGLLGASAGFSIADLASVEDRKTLVSATMAGAALGLGIGHLLTSHTDFSDDQGTSVRLYTSLGTVLGLGTAYVISKPESDRTIYVSLATLGASIGFAAAYYSADNEQSSSGKSSTWHLRLDPAGIQQKFLAERGKEIIHYTPALKLEYQFQ